MHAFCLQTKCLLVAIKNKWLYEQAKSLRRNQKKDRWVAAPSVSTTTGNVIAMHNLI